MRDLAHGDDNERRAAMSRGTRQEERAARKVARDGGSTVAAQVAPVDPILAELKGKLSPADFALVAGLLGTVKE